MGRGKGTLTRLTLMTLRHPVQVTLAVIATILAASLQLAIPVILGRAIDQTQTALGAGGDVAQGALLASAILLLFVSIGRGVFTTFQNYFSESVGHHVAYELRLAIYDKVQSLSFSFHDRMHSGDLITVGMLDVEGVRHFFSAALIRAMLLAILVGFGAFLLLSTDFVLGLVALSFVPFVAWRSVVTRLRLRATWWELQDKLAVLTRVMEENLAGIRVVRAFAAKAHEMAKFDVASKVALALQHKRIGLRTRNASIMSFSFFLAMGLVLFVGGNKVIAGEITVGTLTAFLTFMTILQMPVRQLGLMVNGFARASTCGGRLFDLIDTENAVEDAPDARDLVVGEGIIRFDNVSFAYPGGTDRRVLDAISFEARTGETLGICGPPGSGKSTLAHLLPRFYDVDGGTITIDGQDVRDVTLRSLRQAVVVVQQDAFLFTTTIENNIAYGNPWAEDAPIERAAESAQLHAYIMGLPAGYGTVVGERGISLSGGQRQRLSIARSLMLDPAVMILDDSTAAIDAGTERRIRQAMQARGKDRLTLIIAHRLSSLMHADRILFLKDGRIVEQGSHDELLALGGHYRALYDLQANPGDNTHHLEEGVLS